MSAPDIMPLYLHPHNTANEPVTLHEGPVVLRHDKGTAQGTGATVLRWLPSTGLRLEVDVAEGVSPDPGTSVKAEIANSVADALITHSNFGVKDGVGFAKAEAVIRTFKTGNGDALVSLGFQVVNFVDFLTPGQHPAAAFGFPPLTAELATGVWRIRLTAVEKSTEVFKNLAETGGYAFTHVGILGRTDGATFTAADAEPVLTALRAFLSFSRGAACNLPIQWGLDADDNVVWQQWGSPVVDAWRTLENWFDEHHGNLLSEIFPAFAAAYADSELGQPLQLALHWYQKSNTRAGGMEGAIILGVTNLDLLAALVVVDRAAAMHGDKFDWLAAEKKLRMLLGEMKAPQGIPAKYADLSAFSATNGWTDGPAALANIRHGYVHANKKNRKVVLAASNLATFQAWQLSLWYQELALLHLLDHKGEYRNRVTAEWRGIVERVPWA